MPVVVSILLYVAYMAQELGLVARTQSDKHKLESFQMSCMRRILGVGYGGTIFE